MDTKANPSAWLKVWQNSVHRGALPVTPKGQPEQNLNKLESEGVVQTCFGSYD
jgi:hypothetical protein